MKTIFNTLKVFIYLFIDLFIVSFKKLCVLIRILTCKVLCMFLLNYLQDKYSIINQKSQLIKLLVCIIFEYVCKLRYQCTPKLTILPNFSS